MIEKQILAKWLYDLARRPVGASDRDHVAGLRAKTNDSTWALYLDSIQDYLARGWQYGNAIADPMCIDLSKDVQARLRMSKDSAYVDEILLEAAFDLLLNLNDHNRLKSMFDRAGLRYSLHRDYSRGPGAYDIDLYTAKTISPTELTLAGETVNVSFTFTDVGELDGVRSYSMGKAPANPLRRGEEPPIYRDIVEERRPRRWDAPWWLRLTAPVRFTSMTAPAKVVQFFQGWAMQGDGIVPEFEKAIEIRGCARPFRGVDLIEIGDVAQDGLQASRLTDVDRACMERLLADHKIKWCLYPSAGGASWDLHPYNCYLLFGLPKTERELEAAKDTYNEEIHKCVTRSQHADFQP